MWTAPEIDVSTTGDRCGSGGDRCGRSRGQCFGSGDRCGERRGAMWTAPVMNVGAAGRVCRERRTIRGLPETDVEGTGG